ncbi:MAG: hypothetical protein M3336_04740 [Chloroflexota bacterium]|nr:hypothetical protein [Chloroflexota bacterium]
MALATFLQLLRPHSLEDERAVRVYRDHAQHVTERVREVFDSWVRLREVEPEYVRLANTASVNRWALLRLADQVERLRPPRRLGGVHRDLLEAVRAAARACQLLANGYRFHKSDAICDGQALLLDTVQELETLLLQVDPR